MKGTWQGSGTWQTSGGGVAGLVALAVVLAVIAAVLHAIWHAIVEAAEVAAIVVVSVIAAAVLGGVTCAAVRIGRYMLAQRVQHPVPIRAEVIRLEPEQAALEAPRPADWPLPGWWAEVRPDVGHDDERR